jgi:hypothetical protein
VPASSPWPGNRIYRSRHRIAIFRKWLARERCRIFGPRHRIRVGMRCSPLLHLFHPALEHKMRLALSPAGL